MPYTQSLPQFAGGGFQQSIQVGGSPQFFGNLTDGLLTSGPLPPNPSELLGSDRMADLLHRLQDEFDMVIMDTPPVASVADALVLAHRVDGVVLVVEGSVRGMPRDVVQRAKNKLDQVKANILGVVLNKVDLEREQPYYYYYNYSAAYYMGGDSPSR